MGEPTVEEKVLKQVDYYFGDNNFPRDKFMKTECAKDDGWIKIETLLTFNRLKNLVKDFPEAEHVSKIAEILKASNLVDVDESGNKLRRNPDVPLDHNTEARTIYLKGFPKTETKLDDLFEFFKKYEGVEAVIMRWYKEKTFQTITPTPAAVAETTTPTDVTNTSEDVTDSSAAETKEKIVVPEKKVEPGPEAKIVWIKKFKGSILVVFKTVELATKFMAETDIVFMGSKIDIKMFVSDYKKIKREDYTNRVEARKRKERGDKDGDATNGKAEDKKEVKKETIDIPIEDEIKGALIKLTNIPPTCSREDFKSKWYTATNAEDYKVIYMDFNRGDTEGVVRLEKEGSALSAVKVLPDGKLKMNDDVFIDVAAIDGDVEQKYLDEITAKRMMLKRGGNNQNQRGHNQRGGGRGRGRGGKRGRNY